MRHPYFALARPIILGHRGAAGDAPENTLVAFRRGLELGAQIIETDVHATRDGVPVLLHDPEVDRTTDGSGPVRDIDFADLQQLDAAHAFAPPDGHGDPQSGRGVRVPSLEEAFAALPGVRFNLEIKVPDAALIARILDLIAETGRDGITLVTAGEDESMACLRETLKGHRARPALGAALADILDLIDTALSGVPPRTDSMVLQIPREFSGQPLVTRELLDHCHAHEVQVHVWTINEPEEMRELLDLGADGIVTDHPGRMAALLRERDR